MPTTLRARPAPPQRPPGGTRPSSLRGTRILPRSDSRPESARYLPSTVRLVRPSQLLFDAGLAAAVFAFTVALLAHGGIDGSDRELHLWGGGLAAFASLPLAGGRGAPPAVLGLVTGGTAGR